MDPSHNISHTSGIMCGMITHVVLKHRVQNINSIHGIFSWYCITHMVVSIRYVPLAMIAHALYFETGLRTWTYKASELFKRLLLRSESLESFSLRLHVSSCNTSLLCTNRSQCRGVFLILRRDNKYFAIRSSPTTESLTAPACKLKRTTLIWHLALGVCKLSNISWY